MKSLEVGKCDILSLVARKLLDIDFVLFSHKGD